MLFLLKILTLLISFKAKNLAFYFDYIFQTLPNPPFPITVIKVN